MKFLFKGFFKTELEELEKLKAHLESYNTKETEIKSLKIALLDSESEIGSLKAKLSEVSNELDGLKNKLQQKTNEQTQANSQEVDTLKKQLNDLNILISKKDSEIETLNKEKSSLNSQIEEINNVLYSNNNKVVEELEDIKRENSELRTKVNNKESELNKALEEKELSISNEHNLKEKLIKTIKTNEEYELKIRQLEELLKNTSIKEPTTPLEKITIKSILVVDDSNIILMQIKKMFETLPFKLQTVNSAKKALEMLKTDKFDLIITDVNMPEMNGIDFTLNLKKEAPNTHLIIMTAFENPSIKNQKFNLLCTDKPLNLEDLQKLIKQIEENSNIGKLSSLDLKDLIFMLSLSKKDEYILIKDSKNNQGKVFLSCGDVFDAEYLEFRGKEAISTLAKLENTSLDVFSGKATDRTINLDIIAILSSF